MNKDLIINEIVVCMRRGYPATLKNCTDSEIFDWLNRSLDWPKVITLFKAMTYEDSGKVSDVPSYLTGIIEEEKISGTKTEIFNAKVKPPLGIMPEKIWKEERIWELIACLNRNKGVVSTNITKWADELGRLLTDKNAQI